MEIPRIIKVLKEITELRYIDLYKDIKETHLCHYEPNKCVCGVNIIENHTILLNGKEYIIGSTCIINIRKFLDYEYKENYDSYTDDELKVLKKTIKKIDVIIEKIKETKKNRKEKEKQFFKNYSEGGIFIQKFLFETENEYEKIMNEKKRLNIMSTNKIIEFYEKYNINRIIKDREDQYNNNQSIWKDNYLNNYLKKEDKINTIDFGKYKGKKYYEINDLNWFHWILKEKFLFELNKIELHNRIKIHVKKLLNK